MYKYGRGEGKKDEGPERSSRGSMVRGGPANVCTTVAGRHGQMLLRRRSVWPDGGRWSERSESTDPSLCQLGSKSDWTSSSWLILGPLVGNDDGSVRNPSPPFFLTEIKISLTKDLFIILL